MNGKNKISICMATHNGGRYIRQQLASILMQLGPDDELIISDDSSTDDTLAIINSFADPHIRLFANNTFYSPIFNFENALKQATGEIIVLADQDDIWLDNKLAVIRDKFRQRPAPVYLVALDGVVIDEEEAVIAPSILAKLNAGPGLIKNVYDNTTLGCCLAFSRELLAVALPFPKRIPMHDIWIGLIAQLFGQLEFVPEKTMMYRKHSASLTEFRIRFIPVTQIKRRWWLVYNLAKRWIERR